MNSHQSSGQEANRAIRGTFTQLIHRTPAYRYHVLESLYGWQTHFEREHRTTFDLNYRGFTAPDAPLLTKLAEQHRNGQRFSVHDDVLLKSRLPKYWRQFVTILTPDALGPKRRGPERALRATGRKGRAA